jgi:ABC-type dipeptide/oligopeptide/nickel transport system permease component
MTTYLIRRLLLILPTLLGSTAVVFFVAALTPGGFGGSLLSADMQLRPAERKAREAYLKQRYALDKPLAWQYFHWLNEVSPVGFRPGPDGNAGNSFGFKSPDLGRSWTRERPVEDLIKEALPTTLLLEFLSLPIIYGIAIFTGIRAARARGQFADVAIGTVLIALFSLPEIWVAVLLIGFMTNVDYVHWFPSNGLHDVLSDGMTFLPTRASGQFERGWLLDTCWHLVIPLTVLSYGSFAFLSRLTRASLLETLTLDFARTARAKGLPERIIVYRHVLRNSLIGLITVAANILPGLISGSVVVETIMGIPGMGKLFIDAVDARDKDLYMAIILIGGLLTLIGYLVADIAYAIADPRVSYVD